MTKEEAIKIAMELSAEVVRKEYEIEAEARKNGTWQRGLDANNGLFEQIYDEFGKKLCQIESMIDE